MKQKYNIKKLNKPKNIKAVEFVKTARTVESTQNGDVLRWTK